MPRRNIYKGRKKRNARTRQTQYVPTLQLENVRPSVVQAHVQYKDTWTVSQTSNPLRTNSIMLIKCHTLEDILSTQQSNAGIWTSQTGQFNRSLTGGSRMPLLNQLQGQYSHYFIMGAKITVTVKYLDQQSGQHPSYNLFVGVTRDSQSVTASTENFALIEANNFDQRTAICGVSDTQGGFNNGVKSIQASAFYSPKNLLGCNDVVDNDELQNAIPNGPAPEGTYFAIAIRPNCVNAFMSTSPHPFLEVSYKVEYRVRAMEPTNQRGFDTITPA